MLRSKATNIFSTSRTSFTSRFSVLLFAAALLLSLPSRSEGGSSLRSLRSRHPRLLFLDSDLPGIKRSVAEDPFVETYFQRQLAVGERLLSARPDAYRLDGSEHSLLNTARDMEGRIFTLAGLYRVTGDRRFADRAAREMLAAASFPDWNPGHFLDTAEMTAALGLGYDWLYPALSPADRAVVKNALVTKGILPWLSLVRAGKARYRNNWSQVCNGGETIGALAVADEEPELAAEVLEHARSAMDDVMKLFAPDGGFEEGPGYWNYAVAYNALYIAALDSALGTDFGASKAAGFSTTVDYHIQSTGPTLEFANFGDASPNSYPSPEAFWFARRFDRPAYAAHERKIVLALAPDPVKMKESARFSILGVFWAALTPGGDSASPLPLVQSFSRVGQAYMRGSWDDPNAWYVGFKGGDARASHGHLDLGSFVMDALGRRWASDLEGDSYGLPGYFGAPRRWTYYRLRTEGHNTLTIDGLNEDLDAEAPLVASGEKDGVLFAVADLDRAYKVRLSSWRRGVSLIDKKRVLVQDEISPTRPVDAVWHFHTFAGVEIAPDGRSASLTAGGAVLRARILAPDSGRFSLAGTQAPPPNAPNPGLSDLVIRLPKRSGPETIAVLFARPEDQEVPSLEPLSTWK